jgi:hypothetical protein
MEVYWATPLMFGSNIGYVVSTQAERPNMSRIIYHAALLVANILKVGSVVVQKMEEPYFRTPSIWGGLRRGASKRLIGPTVEYTSANPASVKTASHSCSLRKLISIPASFSISRDWAGKGFSKLVRCYQTASRL